MAVMGKQQLKTKWDLSPLFEGDDDPEMKMQRKTVEDQTMAFVDKWRDRNDYLENVNILKEALDEYEDWVRNYGTSGGEGYYWELRTAQEQDNPNIKAKLNQVVDSSIKLQNEIQFFELRIAKVSEEKQKVFLADEKLKVYRHWLEKLFLETKHLLSEPEEKILNLKSMTAYANWVKMTQEFVSKEEGETLTESGKKEVLNFSQIMNLLNSRQKKVRDDAARVFNGVLVKHVDIAEIELNSVLQDKKVNDGLRKFSRPDAGRHLADDIESDVVDALVKAVTGKFDIPRRFYKLKAKLLGVPKLKYHERNVPYGKFDEKYEWDKAMELVSGVFSGLDVEFGEIFDSYIKNGQMDVFPDKGKTLGAFCAHDLMIYPTYILLNHSAKLNDVRTLAHEVGHGIHNELMKNQNSLNFGTPKSMAEVASTFMEDFVLEKLSDGADEKLRLALNMSKLNDDVSTIFRQIACYRFEQELHDIFREVGYLSKVQIGELFKNHMSAYMGDSVEQSEGAENWWVYWGHIRNFFYNYSYASGLLISKALQGRVQTDRKFIFKVKECLARGTSASPRVIFSEVGINIADKKFWVQGLEKVEELLTATEKLAE